ncbi:putative UDP-glucose:glycoprotein glucosyltransferase [Aspergillus candidus]|uniref:UDP-glucose:Glyco protein glucosyltransferase-domain-containing protein n=1 Tax=Aspergillus candidus TaxID=41067 RepID=A0A2I2FJX8_ASPCN|nr:UDP-glucose:Glyco protein glucosyltransferase-domain-containing protein [Aspergillus candidus]PLB40912.1 UDP-glucose:Glyco protein glucosyltransferase-domain-containing protein [Aspergillus candidus]
MHIVSRLAASCRLAAVGVALLTPLVHASPSVNVALQASFDSPQYLVELLETAAEENSTAYFPLLDRIADGAFDDTITDKELYDRFLQIVSGDGHLRTPESLSSFKVSLAIRSATPRIAAHYQYYNASVQQTLMAAQDAACPVWVHTDGKQYCSSAMERAQQDVSGELDPRELPFDRVLGDLALPPAVLYADVSSPMFKDFHLALSALAKEGQISYRIRYRPSQHRSPRPLFVSGYGVELALKRTDYIVIDDRDAEQREGKLSNADGDAPDDLKPLSASEVSRLGVNTVSYVMDSDSPLDTLIKLSQDFPKYSANVAAHDASPELLQDIRSSRLQLLPPGTNVMWINGVQVDPREIDAFSLLDTLRRERKLIEKFRDLGISATEAVDLLSHEYLGEALAQDAPPRYNYRDEIEGGRVIIWMNDVEKDARYEQWPSSVRAYLQRSYPGQLPAVRRNANNIVIPVDLSSMEGVQVVINNIKIFVQNNIPVRFGLVPVASSPGSSAQLKVAHYLQETFGLASLMQFLEETAAKKSAASPDKACFEAATQDRTARADRQVLTFEEVLKDKDLDALVARTADYQKRLGIEGKKPPILVNGAPVSSGESWMQEMSVAISKDIQTIQQGVAEGVIDDDTVIYEHLLAGAFDRRTSWVVPEDPKDIQVVDIATVSDSREEVLRELPHIASQSDNALDSLHLLVVGDFDSGNGQALLTAALESRGKHPEVEVLFLHNPTTHGSSTGASAALYRSLKGDKKGDATQVLVDLASYDGAKAPEIAQFWEAQQSLAKDLGFAPGARGVVINGRTVGPIQENVAVFLDDLDQLFAYEQKKRIDPVAKAVKELGFGSKLSGPLAFAKLTSLTTLSTISDVPEGISQPMSEVRLNLFGKWEDSRSTITVSSSEDPAITIVASIDPTSEVAQRWLPILKVLSELASVRLRLFLNPREQISELPTKRFYRYVLDSEPSFDDDGALSRPTASFSGVPIDALLTLGMDVPSPWLVAPKESIHDLDNIKLSSVRDGADVDAIYALEHILIEGHSRDTTIRSPPSGVQLVLGTDDNPHFADTIIMANLGYFQFKAQPGLWKIDLKPGRSERIYNIDSVGSLGYSPQPGDENTEVALLSFQGKTLFPRLSRKKGQENEDVLETGPQPGTAMDYVSKGLNFASGILSSVGVGSKGEEKHADINIFSVASGHLYERMLNIMMVSVMRNTNHSVKFWFIEQFLSPSFKSFLPHLAKEYGFSYEMVTYKWPHWLRAQSEKQRQIWGYKILFLDVLFPLSLDKVIFVDADQIVRTDMYDLVTMDLEGAPYGFTPMCDSREEMEGFRFWKQGYWKNFLRSQPYHISALYVVDLNRFRALAAGDRLRGQYQMLSADKNSLSNLDQDLPNHMQHQIPIKSLPQEWLWCETWCSDASLTQARTIDLCNNPQTKEPKLDRARRQVPEWTEYDEEIAALSKKVALEQEVLQKEQEQMHGEEEDEDDDSGWDKDEL